jgi:hypothetical protein
MLKMKWKMLPYFSIVALSSLTLLLPLSARAQDIGSFFISANYALKENRLTHSFTTHTVDDLGIALGFILPITGDKFDLSYKGRIGVNGVKDVYFSDTPSEYDARYYRNLDHYLSGLNEILVGTHVDLSQRFYMRPQVGLGFLFEVIYGNGRQGIAYGTFQFDLSTQVMYSFRVFDVGLLLTYEHRPLDGYFNSIDQRYFTIGAVISK